jgi:hypothetical protein
MPHRTFEETQRFSQLWLWIVILGVSIIMLFQVPIGLIHNSGDAPMTTANIIILIFSLVFVVGINALFYFARLVTKIDDGGVHITFHPFFSKTKTFSWDEIEKAYVRKYNSFLEYGGWGIRFSWKGRAYNTSGNRGLQLIMGSGKKILIGTHKPEELDAFLKKYIFAENLYYE